MTKEDRKMIMNPQLRDNSSKLIFGDNILCAQFLRDYADLEILRHVQPEDIEDVSERYVPLYSVERESDTVKKVNISRYVETKESGKTINLPLYIVSLVEHKTKVEYNVSMQILRYTVHIWEDYEKEMEKKYPYISRRKEFRYPPVLPIVYYEGTEKWTASTDLADRILCGELLGGYLPHFRYQTVRLHDYSNEDLLAKGDEISLAMLINKIRNPEDMKAFTSIPDEQVDEILKDTPDYLLSIMEKVLRALLYNMDMDEDKTENAVSKIKERKMGVLFEGVRENFEAARKRDIEEAVKVALEEAEKNREQSQREMEIFKYVFKLFRDGYSEPQIKEALQNKYSLSVEQAEEQYRKVMED